MSINHSSITSSTHSTHSTSSTHSTHSTHSTSSTHSTHSTHSTSSTHSTDTATRRDVAAASPSGPLCADGNQIDSINQSIIQSNVASSSDVTNRAGVRSHHSPPSNKPRDPNTSQGIPKMAPSRSQRRSNSNDGDDDGPTEAASIKDDNSVSVLSGSRRLASIADQNNINDSGSGGRKRGGDDGDDDGGDGGGCRRRNRNVGYIDLTYVFSMGVDTKLTSSGIVCPICMWREPKDQKYVIHNDARRDVASRFERHFIHCCADNDDLRSLPIHEHRCMYFNLCRVSCSTQDARDRHQRMCRYNPQRTCRVCPGCDEETDTTLGTDSRQKANFSRHLRSCHSNLTKKIEKLQIDSGDDTTEVSKAKRAETLALGIKKKKVEELQTRVESTAFHDFQHFGQTLRSLPWSTAEHTELVHNNRQKYSAVLDITAPFQGRQRHTAFLLALQQSYFTPVHDANLPRPLTPDEFKALSSNDPAACEMRNCLVFKAEHFTTCRWCGGYVLSVVRTHNRATNGNLSFSGYHVKQCCNASISASKSYSCRFFELCRHEFDDETSLGIHERLCVFNNNSPLVSSQYWLDKAQCMRALLERDKGLRQMFMRVPSSPPTSSPPSAPKMTMTNSRGMPS